jgi:hypothetical protein
MCTDPRRDSRLGEDRRRRGGRRGSSKFRGSDAARSLSAATRPSDATRHATRPSAATQSSAAWFADFDRNSNAVALRIPIRSVSLHGGGVSAAGRGTKRYNACFV